MFEILIDVTSKKNQLFSFYESTLVSSSHSRLFVVNSDFWGICQFVFLDLPTSVSTNSNNETIIRSNILTDFFNS